MITWIEFKTVDGKEHPEAELFRKSHLSSLILHSVLRNYQVFNDINPITVVFLSEEDAELHTAPDSSKIWQRVTRIPVNVDMFRATKLTEHQVKATESFFDCFGRDGS